MSMGDGVIKILMFSAWFFWVFFFISACCLTFESLVRSEHLKPGGHCSHSDSPPIEKLPAGQSKISSSSMYGQYFPIFFLYEGKGFLVAYTRLYKSLVRWSVDWSVTLC